MDPTKRIKEFSFMREFTQRKKGYRSRALLLLAVVLLLVVMSFVEFTLRLNTELSQSTDLFLHEVSSANANVLRTQIDGQFALLNYISLRLGVLTEEEFGKVIPMMSDAVASGGFYRMAVAASDGIGYTSDGKVSDVSGRDYFQRAMLGESSVSSPLISNIDNLPCIALAVPVRKNGQVVGVLRGMYSVEGFAELLLSANFSGIGYAQVIEPSGNILVSGNAVPGQRFSENIFNFYDEVSFSDRMTPEILQSSLRENRIVSFSYHLNGQRRIARYQPLGVNDWYIVSVVDASLLDSQVDAVTRNAYLLVTKLLLILGVCIALLLRTVFRSARDLQAASLQLTDLTTNAPCGMQHSLNDSGLTLVTMSNSFLELTGYTRQQVEQELENRYLRIVHPEDRDELLSALLSAPRDGRIVELEYRIVKRDGAVIWVMDQRSRSTETNGVESFYCALIDITSSKAIQLELAMSNERYRIAIEQSEIIIYEYDCESQSFHCSDNLHSSFKSGQFSQLDGTALLHPDDVATATEAYHRLLSGASAAEIEVRLLNQNGKYVWCHVSETAIRDTKHRLTGIIGGIRNIDAQKRQINTLIQKSTTDALTGVLNRSTTESLVDDYLARRRGFHALLVIDLDNFKVANDSLGHLFGDTVLRGIGTLLQRHFTHSEILGRMGGDEFVVFLPDCGSYQQAGEQVALLCSALEGMDFGSLKYRLSVSVGVAVSPRDGTTYQELFSRADRALYLAKAQGRGQFVFHDPSMESSPIPESAAGDDDGRRPVSLRLFERDHIISYIFAILEEASDVSSAVDVILATVGRQFGISHAYIFQRQDQNGSFQATHTWRSEHSATEARSETPSPTHSQLDPLLRRFQTDPVLVLNSDELPGVPPGSPEVCPVTHRCPARSAILCAIYCDGKVQGFIGFEDRVRRTVWNDSEVKILSVVAKVLGNYLIRLRLTEYLDGNQQFHDALATLGCDISWDYYPDTGLMVFSSGFSHHTGWDQTVYSDLSDVAPMVHPDDLELFLGSLCDVSEGRSESFEYALRLRHADGSYGRYANRCMGIRGVERGVRRMVGISNLIDTADPVEEVTA